MLFQIPGAIELVVILLIAVLVFGIPLLLIAVVGLLYFRADSDDEDVAERVAQLEDEIAQLRAEVGDETRDETLTAEVREDSSSSDDDS